MNVFGSGCPRPRRFCPSRFRIFHRSPARLPWNGPSAKTLFNVIYVRLCLVVAQFLEVVSQLVDGGHDVPFGVVGGAQGEVDDFFGIFFAVPAAIGGVDFLPFFGSQVKALELSQYLGLGWTYFAGLDFEFFFILFVRTVGVNWHRRRRFGEGEIFDVGHKKIISLKERFGKYTQSNGH